MEYLALWLVEPIVVVLLVGYGAATVLFVLVIAPLVLACQALGRAHPAWAMPRWAQPDHNCEGA